MVDQISSENAPTLPSRMVEEQRRRHVGARTGSAWRRTFFFVTGRGWVAEKSAWGRGIRWPGHQARPEHCGRHRPGRQPVVPPFKETDLGQAGVAGGGAEALSLAVQGHDAGNEKTASLRHTIVTRRRGNRAGFLRRAGAVYIFGVAVVAVFPGIGAGAGGLLFGISDERVRHLGSVFLGPGKTFLGGEAAAGAPAIGGTHATASALLAGEGSGKILGRGRRRDRQPDDPEELTEKSQPPGWTPRKTRKIYEQPSRHGANRPKVKRLAPPHKSL